MPDGIRTGFQLTAADTTALADGNEVTLTNAGGGRVQLLLLADFRDLIPDPVLSVRNANPFAATIVGTLTSDDLTELGFQGVPLAAANYFARLNPDCTRPEAPRFTRLMRLPERLRRSSKG